MTSQTSRKNPAQCFILESDHKPHLPNHPGSWRVIHRLVTVFHTLVTTAMSIKVLTIREGEIGPIPPWANSLVEGVDPLAIRLITTF